MQSLIGAKFDGYEGGLVSVENPALLETLVETGSLSRNCVPEAADAGHVVVSLDSDDTAFMFCFEPLGFETFLRHAYLTTAGPQQLILADDRSLYDLLSKMLPAVCDRVPGLTLDRFLRRGFDHPLGYLRMPFSHTDAGIRALERGRSFSGMFSVCPRDGHPACYSTYAWIEDQICMSMAVYDGRPALWLFPFRIKS
jgi:hypothetical protein